MRGNRLWRCRSAAGPAAVLALNAATTQAMPGPGGPPHAFLRDLPHRILREPCRLNLDGDSICVDGLRSRMFCGLIRTLAPIRTTGVGNTAQMVGGGPGEVAGYTDASPADTVGGGVRGFGDPIAGRGGTPSSGLASEAAIWPTQFADSGVWNANSPPFTPWWTGGLSAYNRAQFPGGDWFTGAGTIHLFLYRGAIGVPTGISTLAQRNNALQFLGANDAAGAYLDYAITANPGNEQGPTDVFWTIGARIGAPPGEPDETGRNLYLLGTRYVVDETGLEVSSTAVGGSSTWDHINLTRRTQASLEQFVRFYHTNTVLIWLGENDGAIDTAWYDETVANINTWRSAIRANGGDPRFLLITPYQTVASTTPARCAAIAAYQLQIAQSYDDVGWYGLGLDAGSYGELSAAGWLIDGVHPTASGAIHFGSMINAALEQALGTCYANCDQSTAPPILNVNDFSCFLNLYASADPRANCDGSTGVPALNVLDFMCFLNRWAAGCS